MDLLFSARLSESERAKLSTLIYYPEEKLSAVSYTQYTALIDLLIELLVTVSEKYTREKVRARIARVASEYASVIEELIYDSGVGSRERYYENIPTSIVRLGIAPEFIVALCSSVKTLVIDHLHIVGDVFDRGPRADMILDELAECIPDPHEKNGFVDGLILRDALNRFVHSLPERTQKAFLLRYWSACTVAEVASELSIKENNAAVLLLRTREKLKEFLEKEGFEI